MLMRTVITPKLNSSVLAFIPSGGSRASPPPKSQFNSWLEHVTKKPT